MSNNIEDNIVSMQFDNKQFESGVAQSLSTMDKLKSNLNFPDAGKGLADVNTAVSRFNMNPMASAIQGVSKLWLGLTTVALTAISNITNKVVNMGINLAKSFTIDPITQGFQEYEKNLNSIQTIMANTGASVDETNKYLQQLNHYSDQTIYNFGTMADSIGKFTAAGVKLKPATDAIKGMANSAALGGSSVDQLNTAMYQVSQALSTGTIRLMDWNSISTAGMGGTNMQKAFEATARTTDDAGAAMQAAVDKAGNFRDSLQAGWFSADIFNKTMKVFAGNTLKSGKTVAFTVKQLQGMGYSLKAAKDLNKLSQAAIDSATKVKTFTQLIDVVKESIGSGWSKIFQDLFGNFEEASKLWTSVANTITGQVSKIFGAIDKALVGWRKLGGFEDLWATIGNIFKVIGNIIHPVIALFQALLPSTGKAGSGLAKFTGFLADFTGFLVKLTDPIGDFTVHFGFMGKLFKVVGGTVTAFISALKPLLPVLASLSDYVGDLFNQGMDIAGNLIAGWTAGLDPAALQAAAIELANSWIQWIKDALGIHSPASTMVPIGLNIMQGIVEGLQAGASFVIKALSNIFKGVGAALKWAVDNIEWSDVLDTVNTGLFFGLVVLFKRFVTVFEGTVGEFRMIMGKAGGVLDQMTSNLKTMQNQVRSEIIRNIAISVLLLAGAALLLSTVDTKKLGLALGAIGGMMAGLVGAMRVVTAGTGAKAGVKTEAKQAVKQAVTLQALGLAMIEFATAVVILAGAVKLMAKLDPKEMARGLAGVTAVIALITGATAILGKTGGGSTMLAAATSLIILAAALTAFVGVMKLYSKIDFGMIANGGGKAALVIAAVGLAMRAFGKGAVGGSVGLLIASAALVVLAKALEMISAIAGKDLIKSLFAIVLILTSLSAAALLMSAAEGGAGSMLVMAAALIVIASALKIVSSIPVASLVKAILGLAAVIAIMAGASVLLTPLIPVMTAFGIALLLIGGAIFLAGAGILAFAIAMSTLAVVGPAAFQAIHDGIEQLLELLPEVGAAMAGFVVGFVTGLVESAGPLVEAIQKLIGLMLDGLTKLVPKAGKLITALINEIIRIVFDSQDRFNRAALHFVLGMLDALNDGVPRLIRAGTRLIIAIIEGLGNAATRITRATGRTILQFLHGVDQAVQDYAEPIGEAGRSIAVHLVDGLVTGLLGDELMNRIRDAAEHIADALPGWMKKVLGISSPSKVMRDQVGRWAAYGVADGINQNHAPVTGAAKDLAEKSLDVMRSTYNSARRSLISDMELNPKITPVVDLTNVQNAANRMRGMMRPGPMNIELAGSRGAARDVASEHNKRKMGGGSGGGGGDTYNFNQTNMSPEPINHVKTYRGTKSQIALFKEVTGK